MTYQETFKGVWCPEPKVDWRYFAQAIIYGLVLGFALMGFLLLICVL